MCFPSKGMENEVNLGLLVAAVLLFECITKADRETKRESTTQSEDP